ncbi:MAG: siderophore-interacting protein [Granulosicoccus sp.]
MAGKRKAKELTVSASRQLTTNMLRLTLQGKDLDSLPDDVEGAYFKLVFERPDSERPVMRTYTIARYRKEQQEIDVDFMLHSHSENNSAGVAAAWAMQAKIGDPMSIMGPGPATFINLQADWFMLAADMTALPALTANLALLPKEAKGYMVVEILSEDDRQELCVPANMEVVWVVNPSAGAEASPLFEAIEKLAWMEGQVAIWTACEFKTMKKIRQYYRQQDTVQKSHLYVSSYWKQGLKEEEHKVAKREDSDTGNTTTPAAKNS